MLPGVFCLLLCSSSFNDLMTMIAHSPLFSNPHAKSESYFGLFFYPFSINRCLFLAVVSRITRLRAAMHPGQPGIKPWAFCSLRPLLIITAAPPLLMFSANLVCNLEESSLLANLHMTSYEWSLHIVKCDCFLRSCMN